MEERTVQYGNGTVRYVLERKKVKNINLRVRRDGTVYASADKRVPAETVDSLVRKNGDRILAAVERISAAAGQQTPEREYPEEEIRRRFEAIMKAVYPRFQPYGVPVPLLKIRKMKSRWGSCIPGKGTVTLNARLMDYPDSVIEYVAVHEYCHFLEANHSAQFYAWMTRMLPDWKERKAVLAEGMTGDTDENAE